MKEMIKRHFISIIFFIGVGLFIFYPILNNISGKVFSDTSSRNVFQDGFQFIWNFWWAKKTCLGLCGDFWNTNYQFFPIGSSLLFHALSYINLIIMLPFMLIGLKPVGAYNISLLLSIIFSSLGAYFLFFHLTKNKIASIVSGLIFGISPFLIGHLLDGQHDYVTLQFFPFWLFFLFKSEESKKIIYPVISGILLFIIALQSFTFLIFSLLILSIWLICKIIFKSKTYKELFKKVIIIFTIFFIPFIIFFAKGIKEINSFDFNSTTEWNSEHFSSDLFAFITPTNTTFLGKHFFEKTYENYHGIYSDKSVYLGFSIITLSVLGIISQRKKWEKFFFWLAIGLLSFILSLGPKLHINGKVVSSWMPFQLLEKIPILNLLRAPSRFSVILFLSLSILAGYGTLYILNKLKSKRLKIFAALIITVLIIFEYFPFYKTVRNLDIPKAYEKIKGGQEEFAILDVPVTLMSGIKSEGIVWHNPIYYQTFHEKKIASGYITRVKKGTFRNIKNTPLLNFLIKEENKLLKSNEEAAKTLEKYNIIDVKEILRENKFKYLVFHKQSIHSLSSYQLTEFNDKIKNVLKDHLVLYSEDEELEIYTFKK